MYKIVLLADNNVNELFNEGISITENEEGLEIPPLPTEAEAQEIKQVTQSPIKPNLPTESSFVFQKIGISLGITFISIIILTIILKLYKKFFMKENQVQEMKIHRNQREKDTIKGLETPDDIKDCIKAFLLRTM